MAEGINSLEGRNNHRNTLIRKYGDEIDNELKTCYLTRSFEGFLSDLYELVTYLKNKDENEKRLSKSSK